MTRAIEEAKFAGTMWVDRQIVEEEALEEWQDLDCQEFRQALANADYPAFETEEEVDAFYESAWEALQRLLQQ